MKFLGLTLIFDAVANFCEHIGFVWLIKCLFEPNRFFKKMIIRCNVAKISVNKKSGKLLVIPLVFLVERTICVAVKVFKSKM